MTKEIRGPNVEPPQVCGFVIGISSFLRISSFVIRIWELPSVLLLRRHLARRRQTAPRFQKSLQLPGGLSTKAGNPRDFLHGRKPQPVHRAKFFEQRRLALLANAWKFVQDTFRNPLQTQSRVVGVGESVRFVPHALQQLQRAGIGAQPQRLALAGPINLLELLRQTDDWKVAQPEFGEFRAGGAKLPFAAVDQNQIWKPRGKIGNGGWVLAVLVLICVQSSVSLWKNAWFATWGHAARKISSEIGVHFRPGALTGLLFHRAPLLASRLPQQPGIPPLDGLGHAGEIILTCDRLHFE